RGGLQHSLQLRVAADVDTDVASAVLDADDHALVPLFTRLDEGRPPRLRRRQAVGERGAGRGGGEGAVALLAKLAQPRPVADAHRAHQARACGQGQEGVPETDQATSRNQVFEANAALLVVADLNHLAAALAQRLGDRADELFADVNGEVLDRLHALSVDELDDRLGPGDLELITLATHGLDEDRKVQLATAAEKEALGDLSVGDVQAQVGVQLLVETGAKLAGGRELALAARKR